MAEKGTLLTAALTIWVRNSATSTTDDDCGGISAAEFDYQRDNISVALAEGGVATVRRFLGVIEQDAGGLLLGVA